MNSPLSPELRQSGLWRWLRRLLATALVLATLVGLAVVVENWRGARAWQQLEGDLRSAGLSVRFADLAPAEVADDRNLAMVPGLASLLAYRRDPASGSWHWEEPVESRRFSVAEITPPEPAITKPPAGDWTVGEPIPLAAWQSYYRELAARTNRAEATSRNTDGKPGLPADVAARYGVPADLSDRGLNHFLRYRTFPVPPVPGKPAADVLKALELAGADVDALQAVMGDRPECRFPVHYSEMPLWSILLPHLAKVRQLTEFLRLRACARLAEGEAGGALRDIELAVRLAEGLRSEPILISQWVRESCIQRWLQPVWEGLSGNRWGPGELARLEQLLATVDPQAGLTNAILGAVHLIDGRSDATARVQLLELHAQRPWHLQNPDSAAEARSRQLIRWAPRGWFDQNRVRMVRRHWQAWSNHLAWSGTPAVTNWLHQPEAPPYTAGPYSFLDYEFDPSFSLQRLVPRLIRCTARLHLARTAVALERCRLLRGAHPAELADLVPEFLPSVIADPIDQAPLRYRRLSDGGFVLHSIGLDARDDGGELRDTRDDPFTPPVPAPGDWVWPHRDKR